jgi:WD40 repeat protein
MAHQLLRSLSPLLIAGLLGNPALAQKPSILKGHKDFVQSIAFSPDQKTLVSTGTDRTVRLWDLTKGKLIATLTNADPNGAAVAFTPDGKYFAATCGGLYGSAHAQVVLWEAASQKPAYSLPLAEIQEPAAIAFSRDGRQMATGAEYPHGGWAIRNDPDVRQSGSLEVWQQEDFAKFPFHQKMNRALGGFPKSLFRQRGALSEHEAPVYSLAFTRDGSSLITGGWSDDVRKGCITFWRIDGGKKLREIKSLESPVIHIALSPDGRLLASTSSRLIASFGSRASILILGKELAANYRNPSDKIVRLWNVDTGKPSGDLKGHSAEVTSVAFSPNGEYLATSSLDKTVRLWRVATRQHVATLTGCNAAALCLAVSPDGTSLPPVAPIRILGSGALTESRKWVDDRTNAETLLAD